MNKKQFQHISVGAAVAAILAGGAIHAPVALSAEDAADELDEVTVTGYRAPKLETVCRGFRLQRHGRRDIAHSYELPVR